MSEFRIKVQGDDNLHYVDAISCNNWIDSNRVDFTDISGESVASFWNPVWVKKVGACGDCGHTRDRQCSAGVCCADDEDCNCACFGIEFCDAADEPDDEYGAFDEPDDEYGAFDELEDDAEYAARVLRQEVLNRLSKATMKMVRRC